MDQLARQALVEKLQGHMKKANSNIKTSFVAEKDDFKIILSSKDMKQYYKSTEVGSTKVAELDDDLIEFINNSPDEAVQVMLEGFRQNFDAEAFNKSVQAKTNQKTAAHSTQDEKTWDMVTQKQLDEQKPSLHPRTDDYYTNVTQKQLPEHGQRPGTYDQITEGQFRDERTTFYGADRTAGDWRQEDRNVVTEGQFEEGVSEYSEVGESDRGEVGSKFDGGLEKQWRMIGEKQLMELLKHHEWTEPLTTTEGPDQLQKQDGELSRLTAEVAQSIIKEALQALGNTVVAAGVTPSDLAGIVRKLVSHPSKYPVLANVIRCYNGSCVEAIDKKVAKARYFGKVANIDKDYSQPLVADVLVRQLAAMNYNSKYIVDSLIALAESDNFEQRMDTACEECLKGAKPESKKSNSNVDLFKTVLSGQEDSTGLNVTGSDDDGFYSYVGPLTEVNASVNDKQGFKKAATEFARKRILVAAEKDINLVPSALDVNEKDGTFSVIFYDPAHKEAELKTRANARRQLAKQAQMGGAGGMPPAAGPEMGNPMTPPGGGEMGAPPAGEALSQEPPMPGADEGGGAEGGEPQPPGTICDICGSQDVDVDNGEWRCNNCGGEGEIFVMKKTTKWPGTIEETEKDDAGDGFGLGADDEISAPAEDEMMGEGGGTTLPNVPVGASVKNMLTKLASNAKIEMWASKFPITPRALETMKAQKASVGSICPSCGDKDTDSVKIAGGHESICWKCGQQYKWRVVAEKNGKRNRLFGQYVWAPKSAEAGCSGCNRLRDAFDKALKEYGITREQFDNLGDITAQAPFILKMAKSGVLDNLVSVMREDLPVTKLASSPRWKGSEKFDKFPSASCIEKLARRFGENATAMSGPCEGKSLAKCVCSQLEGLGIYSDGVAAKVAKTLSDPNPMANSPMKTCISMLVRDGFDIDDACVACDGLRAAHADVDDLVIEAIAQFEPAEMAAKPMSAPKPMGRKPMTPKPMLGSPKPMSSPGMGAPGKPMSSPMGQPGGKPMPEPLNDPITDATDLGGDLPGGELDMEIEMGGPDMEMGGPDMGSDLGGPGAELEMGVEDGFGAEEGLNTGFGEGAMTIELPEEAVNALQVLFDALQGQLDPSSMGDPLDMGGITDDTVEDDSGFGDELGMEGDSGEFSNELGSEESESEDSESGSIPGLVDDSTPDDDGNDDGSDFGNDDDFADGDNTDEDTYGDTDGFSSDDSEFEPEEDNDSEPLLHKHTEDKGSKPMGMPQKGPKMPEKAPRNNHEVGTPSHAAASATTKEAGIDDLLMNMKRGSLRTTQSALDNLFDGIMRQAEKNDVKKVEYKSGGEGTKVKATPAQDSSDVKFKDGGKIGHEKPFSDGVKTKPDVPRSAATIGDEDDSNTVDEGSLPTVPHGSPAMAGEKHYRPEKGNVVDGNQGGKKANAKRTTKTAKTQERTMKASNTVWTVAPGHQHYNALNKKANAGETTVKLQDNKVYNMLKDQSGNFVLVAQNSSKNIKESQTVTPNKVDSLVDDPDINQKSGPGKGKTHGDETHSLAVTEKKPSEGMKEPSVPEAPNKGQLSREHTYDNDLSGPEIPAGGGMNSDYDENEKNKPEKLDQMLGKQNGGAATASHDEAIKIAGQMVKANLISIDELPAKVQELLRVPSAALKDYEKLIQAASSKKGLQKEASPGAVETAFFQKTAANEQVNLKDDIQSLFRLDQRNRDHEKWSQDKGNTRLFH